jgi:hypothetical protein
LSFLSLPVGSKKYQQRILKLGINCIARYHSGGIDEETEHAQMSSFRFEQVLFYSIHSWLNPRTDDRRKTSFERHHFISLFRTQKQTSICKSCSATRHGGACGERRYSSYPFLTSALDGGEWSASRPGRALPPGKEPRYPLDRRLGGPQSRSGCRG